MHLLAKLSLKNRALIALVTIVACLFGTISLTGLKQELMPQVQFPAIAVVTSYPGASPEVVNNDVSAPIEEAVRGVSGLEQSSSTSSTGASMVLLEFTYGTDITATEQKVERAISRVRDILPEDIDPQVASGSIDDFPVIQIGVGAPEGEDAQSLTDLLEQVATPELEDIDGVRQVQLSGATGTRVTITPDDDKLAEHGVSSAEIQALLQQNDVLLPAGQIDEDDHTLTVQVGGDVASVDDLKALPLVPDPAQFQPAAAQELPEDFEQLPPEAQEELLAQQQEPAPVQAPDVVTLEDIAEVKEESNPVTSISRINGEEAVTIAITKLSSANTVEVSHAVQELIPELEDALGGAHLTIVFDQAPYIEQSVETLAVEGMLGLLFAVLVILVFLMSVRSTLVTAVSIPTSILMTFIGLNFADYTLNMLTLGALTISIGRVVDDSIVVIENIQRHLGDGVPRREAILTGVREVAGAITASTVTTVAVFLPMAFVSGMVGELFRPFAFTITFALAASLLVALTIVPVLAYWFLKPGKPAPTGDRVEHLADGGAVTRLQRSYLPVIDWTLKRPVITLFAALIVFGGTIASYPLMKTNFMGSDEQNAVSLSQHLEPGVSLDTQLAEVERVEEVLDTVSEIDTVQVSLGSQDPAMALFGGGSDGVISYSLTLDADASQEQVHDTIRQKLDALENAGDFTLSESNGGMGGVSTVDITVSAPSHDALEEGVGEVLSAMQSNDAFVQVESNLGTSRPMVEVQVDRQKAAAAGFSEVQLAQMVSAQMQPSAIGQIVLDDRSVQVYISPGTPPDTRDEIAQLTVPTPLGEKRLDEIATVEVVDGPVTVTTEDGVRSATVSATPAGDDLSVAAVAVTEELDQLTLPGGVTAHVGGVLAEQDEAFAQLGIALLAAVLIVYVVMVATFKSLLQPLLLLVSVPFAATGAILLLIATQIPLGVASLIGVLMLVGIVVTNAIVLIDLVNQLRARGMQLQDAVRTGAAHRYRPIVMTALATIFALTPMALGITGKGGFISQPLAVVVIGGLLSSTVLTLIVLPTLYFVVERGRLRRHERRHARHAQRLSAVGNPAPDAAAGEGDRGETTQA